MYIICQIVAHCRFYLINVELRSILNYKIRKKYRKNITKIISIKYIVTSSKIKDC